MKDKDREELHMSARSEYDSRDILFVDAYRCMRAVGVPAHWAILAQYWADRVCIMQHPRPVRLPWADVQVVDEGAR